MIEMKLTSYRKQRLTGLLTVFILFWGLLANLKADDSPPHNVLVLGDSISSAYGLATEEGWVELLQTKLKEENYPLNVVNASITGDTSSNGLARLPDLLSEYQPALVIIELGGNDGLRGLSIKKLKENLTAMAAKSKDIGADVIITAVQLPGNYGKAYNKLFQQAFVTAADTSGSVLVPSLFEGMNASAQWFQSDGIHPSARAQPLMLENVWQKTKALLEKLSAEK